MSGGSYEYLCRATDLEDVLAKRHVLRDMFERLAGTPGGKAAAQETLALSVLVNRWQIEAETRIALLREVWKAAEWVDSCDWHEDRLTEALAAFAATDPEGAP